MATSVCRICLVGNIGMLNINDLDLIEIYEKLTNSQFHSETANGMPSSVCSSCYRLLQRCYQLSDMAHKSNKILEYMLQNGTEVTYDAVTMLPLDIVQTLTGTPTRFVSLYDYDYEGSTSVNNDQLNMKDETTQNYDFEVKDIKVEALDENVVNGADQSPDNYSSDVNTDVMNPSYSSDSNINAYNFVNIMKLHTADMSKSYNRSEWNTQENSLTGHPLIQAGDKPHACNRCNEAFNDNDQLLAHMQTHTDKTSFFCRVCEKNFFDKCNLTRHMRVHTGERPYACNSCDKAFTVKGHLIAHERIHTGERPYACNICEKTFTENCNLRRHMLRHTGEKPYSCNSCAKTFTEKVTLTRHMQIHTREQPYICPKCNKTFTYKHNLRKHDVRIHLKKALSEASSVSETNTPKIEGLEKNA